jgi:hypothetical protein
MLTLGRPSPLRGRPHPPDCPHCIAVKTGQKAFSFASSINEKEYQKRRSKIRRLKRFNLTQEKLDAMEANQNGNCAICKRPPRASRTLAIDHNHTTGKIRGLLCGTCNTRLGFLEKWWTPIMDYLAKT